MRVKHLFLTLALTALCVLSGARPAYRGVLTLVQPDGTTLQARMQGDEWGHVLKSLDGCALVQDEAGWWCYARFDFQGRRFPTGVRYGEGGDAAARSRMVPYPALRARAEQAARDREAVRSRQRERTRAFLEEQTPATRRALIILAQFKDLSFRHTKEDFEQMLKGDGDKTALAYFNKQWEGVMDFQIDVTDIVTLKDGYKHYGGNDDFGNDLRVPEMVKEACELVDAAVDFSLYDNDGDGEVDNVFVFYAGPDEAEGAGDDYIWPQQWELSAHGLSLVLDGKKVDNYACTAELMGTRFSYDSQGYPRPVEFTLASIGTFCHEYTHSFGIPDLYDTNTDDSHQPSEACWYSLDLMDAGNQNDNGYTPPNYSVVERWYFSRVEPWMAGGPEPLPTGTVTLQSVSAGGGSYILETDNPGEVFLFECRDEQGWDRYIGGSGLLVYHIDRSDGVLSRWRSNTLNTDPDHQCVDLVEPDPEARSSYLQASGYEAVHALVPHAVWPYGGRDTYSASTTPAFRLWSGEDVPVALTGITRNADGSVTFTVIEDHSEKAPAVKVDRQLVFQDAAIIQWSAADPAFTGNAVIRYGQADETSLTEIEVAPYETGRYACIIEGLTPSTPYKVELCCISGSGIPGKVNPNAAFTTRTAPRSGQYPFIYLKDVERNADGSFPAGTEIPLRVFHVPDAEGVTWLWDDTPVRPGADGFFRLTRSGTLKAVVSYADGVETILKTIIVP